MNGWFNLTENIFYIWQHHIETLGQVRFFINLSVTAITTVSFPVAVASRTSASQQYPVYKLSPILGNKGYLLWRRPTKISLCSSISHKSRNLHSHPQPDLSTLIFCYTVCSECEPTTTSCSIFTIYCNSWEDENKGLKVAITQEYNWLAFHWQTLAEWF